MLDWSPVHFGLASLVMPVAATAGTTAAQAIATRRGVRPVAMAAMVLAGAGSLAFSRVSVDGTYLGDLFLGLLILGPGIGAGYVAGSIASLTGVGERDAGLASGLNNASFQIGGAVGVAVLSTVAVSGATPIDGYRAAFTVAVAFAVLGLLAAGVLLGSRRSTPVGEAEPAVA